MSTSSHTFVASTHLEATTLAELNQARAALALMDDEESAWTIRMLGKKSPANGVGIRGGAERHTKETRLLFNLPPEYGLPSRACAMAKVLIDLHRAAHRIGYRARVLLSRVSREGQAYARRRRRRNRLSGVRGIP